MHDSWNSSSSFSNPLLDFTQVILCTCLKAALKEERCSISHSSRHFHPLLQFNKSEILNIKLWLFFSLNEVHWKVQMSFFKKCLLTLEWAAHLKVYQNIHSFSLIFFIGWFEHVDKLHKFYSGLSKYFTEDLFI